MTDNVYYWQFALAFVLVNYFLVGVVTMTVDLYSCVFRTSLAFVLVTVSQLKSQTRETNGFAIYVEVKMKSVQQGFHGVTSSVHNIGMDGFK